MDAQRVYPAVDSNAHLFPYEKGFEDPSALQPPPNRGNVPRYLSKDKRNPGTCSCCCCFGCCCGFLIILVVVFSTLFYLFLTLFGPKPPFYEVQSLNVTAFNLLPDFTLHAEFLLVVQATNPNQRLKIDYGKGSSVHAVYKGSELCSGSLPVFRQGYKNSTVMKVELKGDSPFGSGLQEALVDQKESKRIPLLVFVAVPIKVFFGESSMYFGPTMVRVVCDMVVDKLSPNAKINILESDYRVEVHSMRIV